MLNTNRPLLAAMKTSPSRRVLLAALASSVFLPSCALPPKDAWQVIRQDGLVTYLAFEFGKQPLPPSLTTPLRPSTVAQSPVTVPWRTSPNRYWDTNPVSPVVGTPTAPPPARSTVTQAPKPLQRPLPLKPATPAPVAAAPTKKSAPPPRPAATAAAVKPELQSKAEPKVADAPSAPVQPPAPAPALTPKTDAPAPSPTPPPTAVGSADDLPFGALIAGRPGFVHSPYAMKTQIVDVTGLRPGQEVKCPFTGKLFRVPMGEQAAAKPAEENK